MILKQEKQNAYASSECLSPEFFAFSKFISLKKTLFQFCRAKSQGICLLSMFQTLFFLVFRQRNFWRLSLGNTFDFGRDVIYRFLNSPYHDWRRFLLSISHKVTSFIWSLTSDNKRKVFVIDDSSYYKNRSKKLELLSRCYDHVEKRYFRGFRFLVLAATDGISLIPLLFALLGTQKILCPANSDIDKRSHGAKRRLEAMRKATDVVLALLDTAKNIITKGSYILFDSWFCVPSLIRNIRERALHVVGRLKNNTTRFLFRRNSKDQLLNLKQLFQKVKKIPLPVRKRQQQIPGILGAIYVALPAVLENGVLLPPIPIRIVFLQNKNKKSSSEEDWLAILSTDLELTEEEIVKMYAKRWKIEEFFKVAKSLLHLENEFQGRSYDMLVAHATLVCVRYIFLEMERRNAVDIRTCGELFYHCCDEIPDFKIREALQLIFTALEAFLKKFLPDTEKCLQEFIASLPPSLLRLFAFSSCES